MLRLLLSTVLCLTALAKDAVYELSGHIEPETRASVSIYGATTPFSDATLSDDHGRFRFSRLAAGSYTLAVFVPERGEARKTVEVGPRSADSRGRVAVSLNFKDSDFTFDDVTRQRNAVSTRELSVPERAWREYEQAKKDLARRDAAAAGSHLEKAVTVAPQFEQAWNTLGTIAYQAQKYERAEQCFRQALAQKPEAYEPLVNLGGVLINLHKLDDAREYNQRAISIRPNDALANSQLGMTYFELGRLELAEKYLLRAVEIDPAHFSHPQLLLADVHVKLNRPHRAAEDLESFLEHHPDWPRTAEIRTAVSELRKQQSKEDR